MDENPTNPATCTETAISHAQKELLTITHVLRH
jgi:hypothetical protein